MRGGGVQYQTDLLAMRLWDQSTRISVAGLDCHPSMHGLRCAVNVRTLLLGNGRSQLAIVASDPYATVVNVSSRASQQRLLALSDSGLATLEGDVHDYLIRAT
jgi:hypothetical protein